ncbi:hypothetical protein AAMO2058_001344000 [Amorphochlora amoebiformis]
MGQINCFQTGIKAPIREEDCGRSVRSERDEKKTKEAVTKENNRQRYVNQRKLECSAKLQDQSLAYLNPNLKVLKKADSEKLLSKYSKPSLSRSRTEVPLRMRRKFKFVSSPREVIDFRNRASNFCSSAHQLLDDDYRDSCSTTTTSERNSATGTKLKFLKRDSVSALIFPRFISKNSPSPRAPRAQISAETQEEAKKILAQVFMPQFAMMFIEKQTIRKSLDQGLITTSEYKAKTNQIAEDFNVSSTLILSQLKPNPNHNPNSILTLTGFPFY